MTALASILAAIGLSLSATNQYRYVSFGAGASNFCGSALTTGESGQTMIRAEDAAFLVEAIRERYYYRSSLTPRRETFNKTVSPNLRSAVNTMSDLFDSNNNGKYIANNQYRTDVVRIATFHDFDDIVSAIFTNSPTAGHVKTNEFANGLPVESQGVRKAYERLGKLNYILVCSSTFSTKVAYTTTDRSVRSATAYYYDRDAHTFDYLPAYDNTYTNAGTRYGFTYVHSWSEDKWVTCGVNYDESLSSPVGPFTLYSDTYTRTRMPESYGVVLPPFSTNCQSIASAVAIVTYGYSYSKYGQSSTYGNFANAVAARVAGNIVTFEPSDIEWVKDQCLNLMGEQERSGYLELQDLPAPNPPTEPGEYSELHITSTSNYRYTSKLEVGTSNVYILLEPVFHARTTDE